MRALLAALAHLPGTAWVLLLPPWKRAGSRLLHVAPDSLPRASFVLGLAQIVAGLAVYGIGLLVALGAFADASAGAFWDKAQDDRSVSFWDKVGFNWSGALGYASFLLTPSGWGGLYLILDGILRAVAWAAAGEATGTLAAYPLCAAGDAIGTLVGARRRLRRQGPEMPDRVLRNSRGPEAGFELEVVSARDKPWRPEVAVRIGERFYRLVEVREAMEGGRLRLVYRLAPWPDRDLIRAYVPYAAPAAAGAGRKPPVQPRPGGARRDRLT